MSTGSGNLTQVEKNILDHYTNLQVGDVLRKARETAGYDIQGVAQSLNIATMHLMAIETNDAARLPEPVYAVGFVKAYAEFLGLDKDKIVYLFKRQVLGQMPQRSSVRTSRPTGVAIFPPMGVAAAALVGLLVLGGLGYWAVTREHKPDLVAPVSDAMRQAQLPETKTPLPSAAVPTAAPQEKHYGAEPAQSRVEIRALGSAWVEVRSRADHRKILFNRVMKGGEVYHVPLTPPVAINTGKIENLSILVDGAAFAPAKNKKGVIKDLFLPNVGEPAQPAVRQGPEVQKP